MNDIPQNDIIIYTTDDGKSNISLYARDGSVWLNQNQMAELFATSKPNISIHISNILEDKELRENSVVKFYLTTASDGKICCNMIRDFFRRFLDDFEVKMYLGKVNC